MEMNVSIRPMEPKEIQSVSAVLAQCWKAAYKGLVNDDYLSSLEDSHWVDYLQTSLDNPSIRCIVAKSGESIIGVSILGKSITEAYPRDGEVISLYVLPAFMGRHVGQALFEKALTMLAAQGYANCTVCTFQANAKAIEFYQSFGFAIASQDETVELGAQELPYIIMRKALSRTRTAAQNKNWGEHS